MKVALIGNMNNNHFAIVRYLRDLGIDAELLLTDSEQDHFHPSADTFEVSYMDYTKRVSWGSSIKFLSTSVTQIQNDLEPYSILIGCGNAPAYCHKAGRTLDIFIPYGTDIWDSTFYRVVNPVRLASVWASVYAQRKGLMKCKVWHMSMTNPMYEKQYAKYKGKSERWYEGMPMIYAPIYDKKNLKSMTDRTHWGHEFLKIRENSNLMVVSHMRHHWADETDPNTKGNDILLHGWKQFCDQNKHIKATLVLTEYGHSIDKSRALVKELELESSVVWLPKMLRKDIIVGLHMADIICGEFVHSWMISGILFEALVVGKPILAWRDDALYSENYTNLYKILNAKTSESIAAHLNHYIKEPDQAKKLGEEGHSWYTEEVVKKALNRYLTYFKEQQSNIKIDK